MAGFKTPDFNERTAAARAAKQAALDKLRAKPAPDPALIAERQAAQAAREAAETAKREARLAAIAEAKAEKQAAKAREAEAREAAAREAEERERERRAKPKPTEAELKAARDARYAARKARKR
jgi:hypothetical protein